MKNLEAILLAVFLILFGFLLGGKYMRNSVSDEAIKAGVAEYYLDVDNNKQFRFKGCSE